MTTIKRSIRYFFVMFCFLSFSITIFSQRKYKIEAIGNYTLYIQKEIYKRTENLPIEKITVKDFRFDTTKLGYIHFNSAAYRKIITPISSSSFFTKKLNQYFQNNMDSSGNELLIIIKTLWFEQPRFISDKNVKMEERSDVKILIDRYNADIEVFYGKENKYKAVIKLKHQFPLEVKNQEELAENFFTPFDSLFKKMATLNFDNILVGKNEFAIDEINRNYLSRFSLPVLQNKPQKGVYLSFDDFIQNKPVYKEFTIKNSIYSDELYARNNSKTELIPQFWCYSDGIDYFLRMGHKCYKLVRQNNSFDLFGSDKMIIESFDVILPIGYDNSSVALHKLFLENLQRSLYK